MDAINTWIPQPRMLGLFDFEDWRDWELEPPEDDALLFLPRTLSPIMQSGSDAKEIYLKCWMLEVNPHLKLMTT